MKKPKKPAKKTVPKNKIKAKGKPGGDTPKEKTSVPKGKALKKKTQPAKAKKPGQVIKSAGDPGDDSQKEKTSVPRIKAIGGTGGDSQKGGTNVPRSEAAQKERIERREKFLQEAKEGNRTVYVSRDEIIAILDKKLGGLWKEGVEPFAFIGDTDYYCPPFDEVVRMIRKSDRSRQYAAEIFDCDDFSYELKGDFTGRAFENGRDCPFSFALGIVWLDKPFPHAMNWVISWGNGARKARTLYLVEPQTGELFDIDANTGELQRLILLPDPRQTEGSGYHPYEISYVPAGTEPHRDIYLTLI